VRDINGDGVINDGKELFGEGTVLADGSRAKDGYAAMAALDGNHDGKLDASDAVFKQLQVWVDGDRDGVTDAGELKSLADLGIASLSLQATTSTAVDNGNLIGLVGSYQTTDGTNHQMADVWFSRDPNGATSTSGPAAATDDKAVPVQLSDVLAAPSELTLPGDTAAATAPPATAPTAAPLPALTPKSPEEDELNRQPPLI
jgi:trimeric autotransporter adhesin